MNTFITHISTIWWLLKHFDSISYHLRCWYMLKILNVVSNVAHRMLRRHPFNSICNPCFQNVFSYLSDNLFLLQQTSEQFLVVIHSIPPLQQWLDGAHTRVGQRTDELAPQVLYLLLWRHKGQGSMAMFKNFSSMAKEVSVNERR